MREVYDFRLFEDAARHLLPNHVGNVLGVGSARRVVAERGSPDFQAVEAAMRKETRRRILLASWHVRRRYTAAEVAAAGCFLLLPSKVVEPAGEECGTQYDAATACPTCGAGAAQRGDLFIRGRALRGDADIRRTIANEVILSSRVRDALMAVGVRSSMFGAVFVRARGGFSSSTTHVQLLDRPPYVPVDGATRFGDHPFDERNAGRCPDGDTAGLNVLSEVALRTGQTVDERGLAFTDVFCGRRAGLLRPSRHIVISRPVYEALVRLRVTGCSFEAVRDVPQIPSHLG
jgi:hypothetical protein